MSEGSRRAVVPLRRRMIARDVHEQHRVSSPLELLFDLTFVVAIAQVAAQLAGRFADGHGIEAIGPYLMVFFAIWWAWMNFTWFASAYDTDDVTYRLFTIVQMAGVLLLAAGVPSAFDHADFRIVTVGYLVMRIGLVAHWVRAAVEHPAGRATAVRYAAGIVLVQIGWLTRLALPFSFSTPAFLVLAALDLSVPLWAERTGGTAWHPRHIAERYGLFTIIVLGESVAAATAGVQRALGTGAGAPLITLSVAGLVLLFALWWLYFLEPAGEGLEHRRRWSYYWGYVHYFVFASLAAVGAGLEVAIEATGEHHHAASPIVIGYALAVPVALFYVMITVLHSPLVETLVIRPAASVAAAVITLLLPLAAPLFGSLGTVVAIAIVSAALTTVTLLGRRTEPG